MSVVPAHVLISYWEYRTADLDAVFAKRFGDERPDIFADSGAYSAMTQGAAIDRAAYAAWLHRWKHLFRVYANLDVIGDADATEENQRYLEREGLAPLPVFHAGEPWTVYERHLDAYPSVALGGLAKRGMTAKMYMPWLVRCFRMAEGRAVLHGFGVTHWEPLAALPWHSVDSTTWMAGHRYGALLIFADGKLFQTRAHRLPRHAPAIRALGFTLSQAITATRLRDAEGDASLSARIGIASMAAAEAFLRRRHGTELRIYLSG
jgi:hypothetical protein